MIRDGMDLTAVDQLAAGDWFVVAVDSEDNVGWVTGAMSLLAASGSVTLHPARVVNLCEQVGTGEPGESFVNEHGTRIVTCGKPPFWVVHFDVAGSEWEATVRGNTWVSRLSEHHRSCGGCGELWPCRQTRIAHQAERFAWELNDMCAHCGQQIGSATSIQFNNGKARVKYHQAKKYRANGKLCRDAAEEARAAAPGVWRLS